MRVQERKNFMRRMDELMKIRQESNIFNSDNKQSPEGKRKEQTVLKSSGVKKFKNHRNQ
jgi:hypothetical protein